MRSTWKPVYTDSKLYDKLNHMDKNSQNLKPIRLWKKNSTIVDAYVGLMFEVYNGRGFMPIKINSSMVGHKIGEFIMTRRPCIYKKKSKLKKKK